MASHMRISSRNELTNVTGEGDSELEAYIFILSLGSLAESKILGGQTIVMIADDIESAFTFAQNWPKGSVLSLLLIIFSGTLVFFLFRRIDLDRIIGRR